MRDIRIGTVVAVFVAVLLAGWGARSLYYQMRVVDPLGEGAGEIAGVESIEVVRTPFGGKDVRVRLGPSVHLDEVYPELESLAAATLGTSFGRLIVEDRRTPELEAAYDEVHFILQEGISTGRFRAMAEGVEEALGRVRGPGGVTSHRIRVGARDLFVQLYSSDGYLYEVLPRTAPVASWASPIGGASQW